MHMPANHSKQVLSDEELYRYTGQVAIRDSAHASTVASRLKDESRGISHAVFFFVLSVPCKFLRLISVKFGTSSVAFDSLIAGGVCAILILCVYLQFFDVSPLLAVIVCSLVLVLIAISIFFIIKDRPHERGGAKYEIRSREFFDIYGVYQKLIREKQKVNQALDEINKIQHGLDRAFRRVDEIQALLLRYESHMTGYEFEYFLEDVFKAFGMSEVIRTQGSGDQGIDLIVNDGACRVAIQAKFYTGSVGNSSVQQAVAGMFHYSCDRCAVITNSTFTASAVELARTTGCQLIDGDQLKRFIQGFSTLRGE